jgi:formylglycine-generating enzyme
MVGIAAGFCIDRTEVTRAAYAAWLGSNPSTSNQITDCTWNDDFVPSCEWPSADAPNKPVVCVDWCDAVAYCSAHGQRLCGRVGGGSVGADASADVSDGQWFTACSSGGAHAFPYGDAFDGRACNGYDDGEAAPADVATKAACQSGTAGFAGVFDLSGNVWEWEDACSGVGRSGTCRLRGGSFGNSERYLRCDYALTNRRDYTYSELGFRCCSNP